MRNSSRLYLYFIFGFLLSDGKNKYVFYGAGSFLYKVDADTGTPDTSFGDSGRLDLHKGLGREGPDELHITLSTPGIIYKDLIIVGSQVSESNPAAPGDIRAYNVNSGEIKWSFHTIPHPGEEGYSTWKNKDAWKYTGGANSWAGMALDEKRGIVYIPTGSATFDFYGGLRVGKNLFSDCLIALDAFSGRYLWHYQTVHHDLWDRDLPAPPNLVTISRKGKKIDAVAQITKTGYVFIFNRENGEPLFPIKEVL